MTKCFSQSDDYFIKTSKYVILCRFLPKKEILQLNLMPLIQSSKAGHLNFCQKLRVNKTDANFKKIYKKIVKSYLYIWSTVLKVQLQKRSQEFQLGGGGDFQAHSYDYAKRRLKPNNTIFTRKIFCSLQTRLIFIGVQVRQRY